MHYVRETPCTIQYTMKMHIIYECFMQYNMACVISCIYSSAEGRTRVHAPQLTHVKHHNPTSQRHYHLHKQLVRRDRKTAPKESWVVRLAISHSSCVAGRDPRHGHTVPDKHLRIWRLTIAIFWNNRSNWMKFGMWPRNGLIRRHSGVKINLKGYFVD